jgi:hypothetical protein
MAEARKVARLLAPVVAGGFGLSQRQAAKRLGKPQPWIARRSALNRLPEKVQEDVDSGRIPSYSAYILARLADHPTHLLGVIEETKGMDEHGVRDAVDRVMEELGVQAARGGRPRIAETPPDLDPVSSPPPGPIPPESPPEPPGAQPDPPVGESVADVAPAPARPPRRPRRAPVPYSERASVNAEVELPGRTYAWAVEHFGRFNMRRALSALLTDALERERTAEAVRLTEESAGEAEPPAGQV